MSKKRRTIPSKLNSSILIMTSEEATLSKKPRYNGFGGGYGAHGDTKYNRNKAKRDFRREIGE